MQLIGNNDCARCEAFYSTLTDKGITVQKESVENFPEVLEMTNTVLPIFKFGDTYIGYSSLSEMKSSRKDQIEYLSDMQKAFEQITVSRNELLTANFKDIISESGTKVMELKLNDKLSLRVAHFDPYFMSGNFIQLFNNETKQYSKEVLNLQ